MKKNKKNITRLILLLCLLFVISGCKYDPDMDHHDIHSNGEHEEQYVDANGNGINDYFEEGTHSGDGHAFVDDNADGICDLSQDGGPTRHGPDT